MANRYNKSKMEKSVVDYLTKEGERIIKNAYRLREWDNRTWNLKDSYGSAVYVYGNLQPDSIRFLSPEPEANYRRNDKSIGFYGGERTRIKRGSPNKEFGKSGDKRYLKGDEILAYGRDEVNKFFYGYKLADPTGIELVTVAVMYYAGILESKKYQVISSANTQMRDIAKHLGDGVKVYALDIERRLDEIRTNSAFRVSVGQQIV